jgi:hypothetical protein
VSPQRYIREEENAVVSILSMSAKEIVHERESLPE